MSLVKIIGLPKEVVPKFKVVQLYHNSEPVLLCGVQVDPRDPNYYHAKILEKYLVDNKIEFETFAPNPNLPKWLAPALKKDGIYEVVGMGSACIDPSTKYFQIPYGESVDYKIGYNNEFNELIKITLLSMDSEWKFSL